MLHRFTVRLNSVFASGLTLASLSGLDRFLQFISIAPPAIGFISYIKLTGNLDFFAQILFSLALFFTILVAFMYKNFVKIKFFISWWAFTFPLAAVTLSSILMYELTKKDFYMFLSYTLAMITTLIVILVAVATIKHMAKKEICIME